MGDIPETEVACDQLVCRSHVVKWVLDGAWHASAFGDLDSARDFARSMVAEHGGEEGFDFIALRLEALMRHDVLDERVQSRFVSPAMCEPCDRSRLLSLAARELGGWAREPYEDEEKEAAI